MDAIVLSAGKGQRAKLNYPKQLFRLGGRPILVHLLDIFYKNKNIDNIYITVIPEYIDEFQRLIEVYSFNKNRVKLVFGGETRQQSVYNALKYIKTEEVVIHESARPFITQEFLNSIILHEGSTVVPILDMKCTIVKDIDDVIGFFPTRDSIKEVQLPQKFRTVLLKEAHEYFKYKIFTDDSSLVASYNELEFYKARLSKTRLINYVKGLEENIKITTPLDVKIAEVLYEEYCNSNRW